MGYLADALTRKAVGGNDVFRELLGRSTSATGKVVNVKTAVEVATVNACMRVIGEGIAQVPLKLMRENKGGTTRLPAKEHALYEILACRPNGWQTSFEYREMLAWHVGLTGAHFSFKNRLSKGDIAELIPFEPGQVTVKRADDWTLSYEVTAANGARQIFPAESIWHVRGPSWNSWMGLEAVRLAREAIGLAMASEEHGAKLHKNLARVGGILSVDGSMGQDQYENLRKWVEENIEGSGNAYRTAIIDRGAKWTPAIMNSVDAQHLETRRYQVEEICRFFRVNPIMVGAESKNTTYASAEQMFLAHVVHCLSPWYMRIEQSIDANLLTEADRAAGLYANFVDEGLLRGSMADKKDFLTGMVNGGLMTANEGRAKLDLNPDDDPASDKLRIPTNITGSIAQTATQGAPS
jgi:HK97 family phage portal protein